MARNWANLPQELLVLCSQLLCPKDLSAFRAVCHSWRFAAVEGRSDVPWLMLADEEGTRWREFFCLSCQLVHKALLPEAKGKRCFFSGGWMLTMGKEGELHMLKNPMSCCDHIIKLPNLNKFLAIQNSRLLRTYGAYIFKFSLSDSPATSPDYKVVVIYRNCRRLWLWKPGDEEWSGCFVILNRGGSILRFDADGPTPLEAQLVFKMPRGLLGREQTYLVQSATGSLLLVSRRGQRTHKGTFRFHIFEIDLDNRTWTGVKNLGNMSLFVGCNSSFSLEVDQKHHVKLNCIYFIDDFFSWSKLTKEGGGTDMGIYHLEDGSIEPHIDWISDSQFSPPLWIEPSF
ncbi:hypothetical protein EUGRSUZ_H00630 [Eucalyptus grandis]|uniref:Uncharacterized protein n=2 Tax=Eucalyptus grandis TaxID=71139 RepID=A0ACC3JN62_EUCGR|nr:hypothetical protein EUGRSUZ_H00630 [Eucalyptus grandis]